ncbi:Hop family outer membrane protein HopL [Helicobacter pylori]|uniref:Outer membrane protein n=1 Tax=Helicobacter pylori HP260AFii TaxID=1159077 RepID=A0ABC9S7E6_HELPX|nr:Hop family outer membrane protein HopL [Helicobacter pylori]EMH20618.1 outer membrane protein [Helicobacter pylori GAM260ASi]EMH28556.1 outer membrane protein [Helicobacter pylori GAM268Bii]EMH64083.1 outer membrane protein [Helicobacter pylori HP260AFi]EMH64518.1 outer membrane protein [Helicobacter pylori HP260AFii]EMH68892.1 outer membrane protein [Helicobacter pylori HP260ASii]
MIKKTKKFILFFLVSSLLAEDNGWYMSVGYQIGGTQQFINNKQLLANENIINSVTQSAINIAGPTTGLITLSSQSVIDALGYGVSNTVGNQLEGISNILNQIGKRKDFYSSRQISSISQQIIGLKGSSDPLKAHSSQITAKLLSNTQSAFDQGIALSSSIISSVNSLNPSNNTKEVKAQLQNTAQSMAELLQQIENSITKTTSTTYAQSLLTNLTEAVNASSNNTAYVSALVNALNTLGVGVFPTTTTTHVVLNPPGQIVFYPANSILGSTSSNSNNQQQYNNTLLMNTLQGELSANNQINPNGCANQVQCLEQFIQNLNPLTTTPTSNNQANQQVQAIAQKLQSVAINALDNNAINNTTYNLNNLHNALNFQAYQSTITQYNNALNQISWISFTEPKNLLKNTSNNYQIGTVTNAQGQNISAYDCMTATGSLSSDASSGISCSATSSTSSTNGSTNSFDNSLVATSKIQTIGGKEQIGVNSFNLVSQVWSVYNSLKTSEENLQKNAKILCANGSSSGTNSCGNSGGLSISGNSQLQNILSPTNGTTAQAKSNAPKLKAMVVVNNEEEAKTANLAQNSGASNQSPSSTVMGALNTVLQNVNNFQQSIQNAFQSQSSNIQAWANALYNTSNPNGSQSQNLTTSNNQDLRIQLRANFYQLINTIDQQTPISVQAMIAQSQQTQQTSGATNNNPCANGMNGSNNTNWCYQQWSDSKAYYSGLQNALGYTTQATTQSGSSGGNSITYNVQQITLTSGGLLNQIITNLKGVNGNGGNNGGSSGGGNGTSQISTAYQMLTDASDGKLGTYNSSGNNGSNNGYQTCTNGSNGANSSNCYTPNKQNTTSATTANTATTTDGNLQKVYNDAQKIADIIASSGNNKGVENGLKQFFEALKSSNGTLNSLCTNGSSGSSSSTCSGGLINLLGAIPMNGVSDTNNLVNLLTEFIKTAGFIQNNDSNVSTSLTSAFQAITSAISQGFQSLQNDISPNAILTLLQEITSNTTTIQSFSQTLRQLLGDKTFFMVQQKLIDAMINARNQVQNAQNQANNYGSQPILSQYAAAKSTQHGMSNGLGVGLGYKYFFGKARKLGLRHYFFFDYGFSEIGLANQSVKANIFAYGVGTDFLWNLFRRTYNTKALNFGLFAGVQLGGATWLSSLRQQIIDNWGNANDIHSTNFQVALNFGVRTNFAEFKRFAKKFHNQGVISQKSVEFGIKVPLINQAYLSSAGADVSYRRLYTFYINYIMGF